MLIQLNSKTRRKREFVVIGSSYVKDEDQPSTGSLLVLDITEVVAEPGKPDSNYKFKQIFEEEVRGSVTTVCEISGRFMIGQSAKASFSKRYARGQLSSSCGLLGYACLYF